MNGGRSMQRVKVYKVIAVPEVPFDEYLEKEIIARGWKIISIAPYTFKKSHLKIKIEPSLEGLNANGYSSFDLAVESWVIIYDDGE